MLPVQIELLDERAEPYVGSAEAAGMDLRYCVDTGHRHFTLLKAGDSVEFGTGVKVKVPVGWVGKVYPRSGLGFEYEVTLANTVGVIDSDYRGEIKVKIRNRGTKDMIIEDFERIVQMVIVPHYPLYKNLEFVDSIVNDTARGESGFGGSGKQ